MITVSFMGTLYTARTGDDGKWRITLDSHDYGGPYVMEITAHGNGGGSRILIEDIFIGDVWICSGQSNMEMPMRRIQDDFPEEWEAPVNPLIRQFKVPQEWDFSGPRENLRGGAWVTASAETLHDFSGTAWFFARAMFERRRVPIGLINASWGGTPAEAWMSSEALAGFPEKIAREKRYADNAFCDTAVRRNAEEIAAWEHKLASGDTGLQQSWHLPENSGTQWNKIALPGDFSEAGINCLCGSIWLRRNFEVNAAFAAGESRLWLGTVVDADTVFVNGIETGNTGYRYPPRKYTIPAGVLNNGMNHIVIRVICRNGDGGITRDKDFCIFSGAGSIELGGIWEYRIGVSITGACPEPFFLQRQPTGLFNAMIAPLAIYPRRGVLWYQGESNDSDPHEYAELLRALLEGWRLVMRQPEMPFLIVQLPLFGKPEDNNENDSWAIIREAQCEALSLPAAGMAAGLDLGEWNDPHPVNKKEIGRRLAIAAEQVVFKEENNAPGPVLRDIERRRFRLLLRFDRCGSGLTVRAAGGETPYVSVVAGGKTFRTPAEITAPDTVAIDLSAVTNPEKVLYAWANNPRDRQLYNADGLPVIPFQVVIPLEKAHSNIIRPRLSAIPVLRQK